MFPSHPLHTQKGRGAGGDKDSGAIVLPPIAPVFDYFAATKNGSENAEQWKWKYDQKKQQGTWVLAESKADQQERESKNPSRHRGNVLEDLEEDKLVAPASRPQKDSSRSSQAPHRWDRAQTMHDMKAPDIAKTMMSFVRTRRVSPPPGTLDRIFERAIKIVDTFRPSEIAALFRAAATLKVYPDPRLLISLSEQATRCAKSFHPSDMADFFWSYPSMGLKMDRTLFAALSARIHSTRHHYVGKIAVNVLWSLARMQFRRELGLIHSLVTQIQDNPQVLTPMDIGMTLWSFRSLELLQLTVPVTQNLVNMSMERFNEFGPVDIACLMRSMVLVGYQPSKEQFATIVQRVMITASHFEASATSMFVWSLAMLQGTCSARLREEIKPRIHIHASSFTFSECADVLWATSVLEIQIDKDPQLWNAISKCALANVSECDTTSLSNIMFAYASLTPRQKPEQPLLEAMKEKIAEFVPQFEPDELANLTYAMVALNIECSEALTQAQQKNSVTFSKIPCYRVNDKEVLHSVYKIKRVGGAKHRQELFV